MSKLLKETTPGSFNNNKNKVKGRNTPLGAMSEQLIFSA
jgi:hypothetical protein